MKIYVLSNLCFITGKPSGGRTCKGFGGHGKDACAAVKIMIVYKRKKLQKSG